MKNKVTAKMIRKAVKILEKHEIKPDKDGLIEVEVPKIRTDFLRVIGKRELINNELIIDNEGNTKKIYVKPTLLI